MRYVPSAFVVVLSLLDVCALAQQRARSQKIYPSPVSIAQSTVSEKRELEFIPNRGQLRDQNGNLMPEVLYSAESQGVKFYLTTTGLHYVFSRLTRAQDSESVHRLLPNVRNRSGDTLTLERMDMEFVGANGSARIVAMDTTGGYRNYYLSGSRVTNVRGVRRLLYRNLYPKIDLAVYSTGATMKYDFIVHPGGDPNRIVMRYEGMDSLRLRSDGSFVAFAQLGELTEAHPYSCQLEKNGVRQIQSQFVVAGHDLRFLVDGFDHHRDLTIDPQREWATYFGSSNTDNAIDVAIDRVNNIVISGWTDGNSNIATTGAYQTNYAGADDAFVAKFDPNGMLKWATYFGGSGLDDGTGVAVDSTGNIALEGSTTSTSGIATSGGYQGALAGLADAFLAKFDSNGTLLWSTYFGGSGEEDADTWHSIAADASGSFYITGGTTSSSGIASFGSHQTTIGGGRDAFVAKFGPQGSLRWSTYYGGAGRDEGFTVVADKAGGIVVVGSTNSTSGISSTTAHQPNVGGKFDGMVARFDTSGNWLWGTYYGGSEEDVLYDAASDDSGNTYVAGTTSSVDSIASIGAYQTSTGGGDHAFLAKFNSSGVRQWATYYAGTGAGTGEAGYGVGVLGTSVFLVGTTGSVAGVATQDGFDTSYGGLTDAFVVQFSAGGARRWASYYGGTDQDYWFAIAMDHQSNIILSGATMSTTNIATAGTYQTTLGGLYKHDGMLAKFCGIIDPHLSAAHDTICLGTRDTVSISPSYSSVQWFDGSTHLSSAENLLHYILADTISGGLHRYSAVVADTASCTATSDTLSIFVLLPPTVVAGSTQSLCPGDTVQLSAIGNGAGTLHYQWSPTTGLSSSTIRNPKASPSVTTTYVVSVLDSIGCSAGRDSTRVIVNSPPSLVLVDTVEACIGTGVQIGATASGGTSPYSYSWSPAIGLSSTIVAQPIATPTSTTRYYVVVTDGYGCQGRNSTLVIVNSLPMVDAGIDTTICTGGSARLGKLVSSGSPPYFYTWSPATGLSTTTAAHPIATPVKATVYIETVADKLGCTASDTVVVYVNSPPKPKITASSSLILCSGDSVLLSTDPGFLSYKWSTGATTPFIETRVPGNYSVTVVDGGGCVGSDSIAITKGVSPRPAISGPNTACPNSTVSYSVGVAAGDTYNWSLSGGGSITSGGSTSGVTLTWTTPGTWIVHVSETSRSGCEGDTTLTVIVDSKLTPSITPAGPITLCQGDTVVLRAAKGFVNYHWSTSSIDDSIIVTKSGSYTVTVTGNGGCTGTSQPVVVTVLPDPKPAPKILASTTTLCLGDTAELSTTEKFAAYQWSTGDTTAWLKVVQAGDYSVIVTNSVGCMGQSDTVRMTVLQPPVVTIAAEGPTTFCSNDSVTLSATAGAISYQWNDGETTESIVVRTSGEYSVRIFASNGCRALSGPLHVTVNQSPDATIVGPAAVCPQSQTTYSVSQQPGISYQWVVTGGTLVSGQSTNAITMSWSAAGSGSIEITVTDTITGCSATASLPITIDANLVPILTASGPLTFCQGDSVTLDAGAGYATYQWILNGTNIPNETSEKLTVNTSGGYSVFVTNSGSCQGTSKASVVTANPLPPVPVITESGLTLASTAATAYQWNLNGATISGATQQTITPPQAGNYTVTIFDQNGCSNISATFAFSDSGHTLVAVPPMTTANPADRVSIPLELLSSEQLAQSGAMHFTAQLRFNKTLLAPTGATPAGVIVGNDMIVTFRGTNPLPLGTTSGILQTLDFLATLGTDTCTDITIDSFEWTDGAVSVTKQSGRFCLSGVCEAGGTLRLIDPDAKLSLSQSKPNPATNRAEVEYDLAEQGETELYITDMLGREVKHIVSGLALPGHYTAEFDLTGLAQGSYIYVLKTPSAKLSHLMQVIR